MKKLLIIIFSIISLNIVNGANENIGSKISGTLINKITRQPIQDANILLEPSEFYSTSDKNGKFFFSGLPDFEYTLFVTHISYKTLKEKITIDNSGLLELTFEMSPSDIKLNDVVVSISRYDNTKFEVPADVEIVDRSEIEKSAGFTISDKLDSKSGISIMRDGLWGASVSIRGLSKNNTVELIDGNRLETATNLHAASSLLDMYDMEKVEVIKGASSALYGTGAVGGVVNVVSSRPNYSDKITFSGKMLSGYNSVNSGSNGNLQLNLATEKIRLKLNSSIRYAENYTTPNGKMPNSQYKDNSQSAFLGIKPFDNHELLLNIQRYEAIDVGIPGGKAFPDGASAYYPLEQRNLYSVEYKTYNLLKFLPVMSLKYFNQKIVRDVILKPNPAAILNPSADHYTNGLQFLTNLVLSKNNLLIAGIDIWQREYNGIRKKTVLAKNITIYEKPLPDSKYMSTGIFVQDEIVLFDGQLKFSVGGRIDQINVSNSIAYNPEKTVDASGKIISGPGALLWAKDKSSDLSWSGFINSLFKVNENSAFVLNFGRAFRSPSLEERYQYIQLGSFTYWGDPTLKPENNWFTDIGYRFQSELFAFSSSIFNYSFEDLVTDQKISDTEYKKVNIGKAGIYGYELTAEINPFDKIGISAGLSYVRGEDKNLNQNLPEIPPFYGSIGVRYRFINFINANLAAIFYSDQNNISKDETRTPGYTVYNLSLNSEDVNIFDQFDISFTGGIQNIFDKAYRNHLSSYRGLLKMEPGRNYYFSMKFNF